MDKKLFREKSIDRINSPEAMKDYMQVASPSTWMMLIAVVILLAGAMVWSILGRVEAKVPAVIAVENGQGTCYVVESDNYKINVGMQVDIEGSVYSITNVSTTPKRLTADNEYVAGMFGKSSSMLVFVSEFVTDLPDGIYRGKVITEKITPIKFLTN